MMTINEAIAHAEWAADNCEGECSEEHRQLAEWLRELADEQRKVLILMTEVNSLRAENDRYKAENDRLRDFIELLLLCPRDSVECKECRRLNDLCAVELEAEKLGIEAK